MVVRNGVLRYGIDNRCSGFFFGYIREGPVPFFIWPCTFDGQDLNSNRLPCFLFLQTDHNLIRPQLGFIIVVVPDLLDCDIDFSFILF